MAGPERIRSSLENACQEFHRLLDSIPPEFWDRPIPGEDWTIQMEMAHIVQITMLIPGAVKRVSKGKRSFSLLTLVPLSMRYWINGHIVVPRMAKQYTPAVTAQQYDRAYQEILACLETLPDADFRRPVSFGWGLDRTIEDVFYRPEQHLAEHREALERKISILHARSSSQTCR